MSSGTDFESRKPAKTSVVTLLKALFEVERCLDDVCEYVNYGSCCLMFRGQIMGHVGCLGV